MSEARAKLYINTGVVTAKGDTPRLHIGADAAAIASGAGMIIVTGGANDGGTTTRDFAGPVLVANFFRLGVLSLATGNSGPPDNDDWTPSSGASGSPFLAGRTGSQRQRRRIAQLLSA